MTKDIKEASLIICKLLDIAEEHYPKYSSDDFIAECDDWLKKYEE